MKHLQKTEIIILLILWTLSITTYSVALLNNYALFLSDYFGLIGLLLSTFIVIIKPSISFQSVMVLLFLGSFNLLSFVYFFNIVMVFGFSYFVTPGLQLISLSLFLILIIRKNDTFKAVMRTLFSQTEQDKMNNQNQLKIRFKNKFTHLTDQEIETKLQQKIVPEAKEALLEILEERK